MSDFNRLKTMLKRSARDGMAPLGPVGYVSGPTGVARILEQVDIAVLGQRLCFEFDGGSRLVCEASGRRLVRLLKPAPAGLAADQIALFDRDELAADDAQVLSDLLGWLCERGTGFAMTAEHLGDDIDPARGGVAPAAIAEAAGLPGAAQLETGGDSSHEAFVNAFRPSLQAAVSIKGENVSLICGERDEVAFIADWVDNSLEKLLSPGFPLLGTLETNGMLVFALPETTRHHLLVAGRRGSLVVATVKDIGVAAIVDLWRGQGQSDAATDG